MARGAGRGRSGRGSRLPSARVSWLESPDNQISGLLTSANSSDTFLMYDFSSATKYADNFGGGDWTFTRNVGAFGVSGILNTGGVSDLIKVCLGIGMVSGRTSVSTTTDAADIALPLTNPQVSWMIYVCCYINTSSFEVERCSFDFKSQRVIGEHSRIFAIVQSDVLTAGDEIRYSADTRFLLRQRGSRL